MHWVAEFYRLQSAWSGESDRPVHPFDRERAAAIAERAPRASGSLRVLELGAGDGRTAVATAELGHAVTTVELVADRVASARRLAAEADGSIDAGGGSLRILEGDFYALALDGPFDVVAYWDGFGIGEDDDQRRLLRRIAGWLAPEGMALIDIYTPWYWAAAAGQERAAGKARHRYAFDADGVRMRDTYWLEDQPDSAVTQSLRCYGPADLRLLLEGTGLSLADLRPGGAWDDEAKQWHPRVALTQAMDYSAKLVLNPRD